MKEKAKRVKQKRRFFEENDDDDDDEKILKMMRRQTNFEIVVFSNQKPKQKTKKYRGYLVSSRQLKFYNNDRIKIQNIKPLLYELVSRVDLLINNLK